MTAGPVPQVGTPLTEREHDRRLAVQVGLDWQNGMKPLVALDIMRATLNAYSEVWEGSRHQQRDHECALRTALAVAWDRTRPRWDGAPFTDRELAVLRGIAGGLTNREIGRAIDRTEDCVKQDASSLYRKLGARDRAHAVLLACRAGVLK